MPGRIIRNSNPMPSLEISVEWVPTSLPIRCINCDGDLRGVPLSGFFIPFRGLDCAIRRANEATGLYESSLIQILQPVTILSPPQIPNSQGILRAKCRGVVSPKSVSRKLISIALSHGLQNGHVLGLVLPMVPLFVAPGPMRGCSVSEL